MNSIPSSVVMPIVYEYIDGYDVDLDVLRPGWDINAKRYGELAVHRGVVRELLAERMGITRDCLRKRLSKPEMPFEEVDALMCAMDMPEAWQFEPLAAYYEPAVAVAV